MNNTLTAQQVVEAEVEFDEFEEMFADISTLDEDDDGAGVVENQIDQLAADIGLDVASLDGQSLSELAEDEFEQQFIFNFIKRRATKAAERAYRLYKKYGRRCASCAAKIAETLALIKAGKWVKAIVAAISAVRCIRKCIKS